MEWTKLLPLDNITMELGVGMDGREECDNCHSSHPPSPSTSYKLHEPHSSEATTQRRSKGGKTVVRELYFYHSTNPSFHLMAVKTPQDTVHNPNYVK